MRSFLWFGFGLILVCDSPTLSKVGFFIFTLVYSGILFTFVKTKTKQNEQTNN